MLQEINCLHNFRKYHKHINKSDRTEPCSVEYSTRTPLGNTVSFNTKAQLFDYIEKCLRIHPEWNWSDFQMFKTTIQKLIA